MSHRSPVKNSLSSALCSKPLPNWNRLMRSKMDFGSVESRDFLNSAVFNNEVKEKCMNVRERLMKVRTVA
jgi:hypothetical protein